MDHSPASWYRLVPISGATALRKLVAPETETAPEGAAP
jgi:hypothetical protein